MARGQGCTEDESAMQRCAYAGRLVSWLRSEYANATILFENRAVGGQTTGGSLLALPSLAQPVRSEEDAEPLQYDARVEGKTVLDSHSRTSGSGGSSRDGRSTARASIILMDYAVNDAFELQVANSKLDAAVWWRGVGLADRLRVAACASALPFSGRSTRRGSGSRGDEPVRCGGSGKRIEPNGGGRDAIAVAGSDIDISKSRRATLGEASSAS